MLKNTHAAPAGLESPESAQRFAPLATTRWASSEPTRVSGVANEGGGLKWNRGSSIFCRMTEPVAMNSSGGARDISKNIQR
jgi:hypothetical protein